MSTTIVIIFPNQLILAELRQPKMKNKNISFYFIYPTDYIDKLFDRNKLLLQFEILCHVNFILVEKKQLKQD